MLDRTIPYHNMILRCDQYTPRSITLPEGFTIAPYQKGYEQAWAYLEYSIGDFSSVEDAESFFVSTYLKNQALLPNILFIKKDNSEIVGSCIAWRQDQGDSAVSCLRWLLVNDHYQGIGLGKALCYAVMNIFYELDALPVYIHTQPWSWKAIFLYLQAGFKIQKNDSFSNYENEYIEAMATLQHIVSGPQFMLLQELSED